MSVGGVVEKKNSNLLSARTGRLFMDLQPQPDPTQRSGAWLLLPTVSAVQEVGYDTGSVSSVGMILLTVEPTRHDGMSSLLYQVPGTDSACRLRYHH